MRLIRRYKIILPVITLLFLMDLFGIYLLYSHGILFRIIEVKDVNDVTPEFQHPRGNEEERKLFFSEMSARGLDRLHGEEQIVGVMKWLMDSVEAIEPEDPGTSYQMLNKCRTEGKGLLCSGMAQIFHEALALLNIRSREVNLRRNIFSAYDTHMTVEVYIEGKWRIYDPTFNVSFKSASSKSNYLGAKDIHEAIIKGNCNEIYPVFYGEVKYPARLDQYYLDYRILFNNVFIQKKRADSIWEKIPPLRYFLGEKFVYQNDYYGSSSTFHIDMQQKLYFIHVLVLPTVILILCLYMLIRIIWDLKHSERT